MPMIRKSSSLVTSPIFKVQSRGSRLASVTWWGGFCSTTCASNSDKTELLLLGTKQQLAKVSQAVQLNVSTDDIKCTQSARNLGVWLDDKLTFDIQVGKICQSCMLNIKKLAKIRRYLTPQSAAVLGAAIVASKLDYCNSILTGISSTNIQRLQRIQYALARVIHRVPCREHITPTITKLHWLPVQQRINFKLALLT